VTTVIDGCAVVTMDAAGTEHATGHVVLEGNRITAVGAGPAPRIEGARRVDGRGCLATPGLVNTHHHLYQWVTRGLAADATLFGWLERLYPVWAGIDAESVHVAAQGALAWLAKTGCTTTADHHYVFPREGGDVFEAPGARFHGPGPQRRGAATGQRRGGPRRDPHGDRGGDQPVARPVPRLDAARRRRAVFTVLGNR